MLNLKKKYRHKDDRILVRVSIIINYYIITKEFNHKKIFDDTMMLDTISKKIKVLRVDLKNIKVKWHKYLLVDPKFGGLGFLSL